MLARIVSTGVLALAMLTAAPVAAQTSVARQPAVVWKIDPTHSEMSFQIRHFVSRVRGTFGTWEGSITADPSKLGGGQVEVAIQTASIDTNNERRDTHLRTDDFFDAEGHPTITFRSRRVETQGSALRVHGDLTIRGVTKPVVLEGEFAGTTKDAQGKNRIGFLASTTINRHDYGVSWNRAVEGANMLGDDVTIELAIEAVQQ